MLDVIPRIPESRPNDKVQLAIILTTIIYQLSARYVSKKMYTQRVLDIKLSITPYRV